MRNYTWVVFRFDDKTYKTIDKQLLSRNYTDIKVYIPTISILKKAEKNKNIYEDVPMLFSYGFIRMSTKRALSRPFLNKLRKDIPAIHSWLRSTETMFKRKIRRRTDNAEDWDDFSIVGSITSKELRRLKKISKENKIYSASDINRLMPGDLVTLKGYPFDNMEAEIVDTKLNTNEVKVRIYPAGFQKDIILPLDNILYSIYNNYSLDKLEANNHLSYIENYGQKD